MVTDAQARVVVAERPVGGSRGLIALDRQPIQDGAELNHTPTRSLRGHSLSDALVVTVDGLVDLPGVGSRQVGLQHRAKAAWAGEEPPVVGEVGAVERRDALRHGGNGHVRDGADKDPGLLRQQGHDLGYQLAEVLGLFSGVIGERPEPGLALAGAVNAAIEVLGRTLALELAPAVRVNVVSPGLVDSPLLDWLPEAARAEMFAATAATMPARRPGTPTEVAQGVLYLLGNAFATGTTLHVDGGYRYRAG